MKPLEIFKPVNMKQVFDYMPYVFYSRFEFTRDRQNSAFYYPFSNEIFIDQIKIFYPNLDSEDNRYSDVKFELYDLSNDEGFQINSYYSFHVNCWGNDIKAENAPSPVDTKALNKNFTATKAGATMNFNIPLVLNSPVHYYIVNGNGLRPPYIDILVKTSVKSGRV